MSGQVAALAVRSADGTRIGYLRQGAGPRVVLVQGAMADVRAYDRLAGALAATHTVLRVERRGRGLSPRPYDAGHDLARDVDDVRAVIDATRDTPGTRCDPADVTLFGLSSGAVIALECARTLPEVGRLVAYEPPFYRDGIDRTAVARLHADLERRALGAALVDSLLAAGTAPTAVRRLPRPVARTLARGVIAVDDVARRRRQTFRRLLPGVRYDFHDVAQVDGRLDTFAAIDVPVLLLRGTASPAFLRDAVDRLHAVLPDATVVDLDGLGHDGPWNGGAPERVARAVLDWAG